MKETRLSKQLVTKFSQSKAKRSWNRHVRGKGCQSPGGGGGGGDCNRFDRTQKADSTWSHMIVVTDSKQNALVIYVDNLPSRQQKTVNP